MSATFIYNTSLENEGVISTYTVVFIHQQQLDLQEFLQQLKTNFQENIVPDHLVIIGGGYLREQMLALADNSVSFNDIIPTRYFKADPYSKFVSMYTFNAQGEIDLIKGSSIVGGNTFDALFRIGLTKIFNKGGLISAQEAHHFVFPSGKHCDKFLRTGNVLIKSQDIYFIAFNLLKRYSTNYELIYCDTSSINSLAFALVELKRRLDEKFVCPHIESYGSYKGFEESEFIDSHKALFLISSSTSANIIDRLKERHIEEKQVVLIYCLNATKHTNLIICDLKRDGINTEGIEPFKTFNRWEKCEFCDSGSMPVNIQGDVFLLEKPVINSVIFKTTDAPSNLSNFVRDYRRKDEFSNHFFKSNFFESSTRGSASVQFSYEVFFDIESVFIDLMGTGRVYKPFKDNLDKHIHQYVPSNTKYIIFLNDRGSELFATYIRDKIKEIVKEQFEPELVPMANINNLDASKEGAAIIICSSMVSGGNLIYVSKELRKFDRLALIYMIGFTRTSDESYYKFIRDNLCQGSIRGKETNSFYSIETIHCNNDYKNTSWIIEQEFTKSMMEFCDQHVSNDKESVITFFSDRNEILKKSTRVENRGFSDQLFYENIYSRNPLKINKNFAFFKFHGYDEEVSQADIYFTISTVINKLRQSKDLKRCLRQSEYVRNLIDPENFSRFNDGIIQACILRSARPLELAYEIDVNISRKFLSIIYPVVQHVKNHYGEALMEFLYAIAIKKLRLEIGSLKELLSIVKERCADNSVLMAMCLYIEKISVEKDHDIIRNYGVFIEMA